MSISSIVQFIITILIWRYQVITAGGVSSGMDAALYLISIMVSEESAKEVERVTQHQWIKGVVVDGIDI